MESPEKYMSLALKAAQEAQQQGGVAIGALLVESATGKVVASGGSLVYVNNDPTAHAEVNCIRNAAKAAKNPDLFGYTLFSTLEPCHMCLSAAAWAKIPVLYFGAYRKDVDESLFDITGSFSDEHEALRMNLREHVNMQVVGGILESDCAMLLKTYHSKPAHS